jgi:hypothetical protein
MRNERLAEQVAVLEKRVCGQCGPASQANVREAVQLLETLALPGSEIPSRHREEFLRVLEEVAVSLRPPQTAATVHPYVIRLLDLLAPHHGSPGAAAYDPVAEHLLNREKKAAQKQRVREQKAAKRNRKAEERQKRRLGLTVEHDGPDRYWSPD